MEKKKLNAFVMRVNQFDNAHNCYTNMPEYGEHEDTIEHWYKTLDCRTIDIVVRKLKDTQKSFDIVCDDEGLLKEKKYPACATIYEGEINEIIFGNVAFCHHDNDGNLTSITKEEATDIMKSMITLYDGEDYYPVIALNY